jgi:brefeldin A-inhibited guanine nucleotide-exchange protein
LNEIYLALLARKNAPLSQKLYFVGVLNRFCADPRALVETYLNYDCDRHVDNIFQTIVEALSKFAIAPAIITADIERNYEEKNGRSAAADWQVRNTLPPPLSVSQIVPPHEPEQEFPREYIMKRVALDSLVETLRSLVNWSQPGRPETNAIPSEVERRASLEDVRESIDPSLSETMSRMETPTMPSTPIIDDDPEHLEKEKARKTALTTAIRAFNFKPKKGVKLLIEQGFIASDSPQDIAIFLLREERLDKAQIGEYLGEGDTKNIEIMHAFVDTMDFAQKKFVDALRHFLQTFRLPGEAQKIDRFMLKFANQFVQGNPNAFANADTAYVLAYSVIMLNTDLHSSKVARRMTKEDFIKNNRGINDSQDLPESYLVDIYDTIAKDEIVLESEREAAAAAGTLGAAPQASGLAGIGQAFSNVGRDLQREAYVQQSTEISHRSEQLVKNLFKSQRRNAEKAGSKFVPASSFKHVGPMFDVTWMSYFSALSSQMQKSHNIEVLKLCLEGMKLAAKVACVFDLATPREAFISALKNCANLNSAQDIYAKNIEALRVLLELGQTEGNHLRQSWKDILMLISQLERLQLVATGVDANSVPDVSNARYSKDAAAESRKSQQRRSRARNNGGAHGFSSLDIAYELTSDETYKSVDRIFTNTANLSGEAIVHFARALTEISSDEIRVSGSHDQPRMYSLQKIVEISYYNMTRVRFQWTSIWDVLGKHFNEIGCHANETIVTFALNSLRQLSMTFMDIEELPGFKFQKDFLKPFEHIMSNSSNIHVKDMALLCLIQMIQAKGEKIRSGWRTMFGAFTVAARDPSESIVAMAYEHVNQVYKTRFGVVIAQGAFTDLIVCLTEFSKNMRFQKKSLQAIETLKTIIPRMLKTPECPLSQRFNLNAPQTETALKSPNRSTVEEDFWFPVLFAFHDVLMTGEDLEVRSTALNYFFDALSRYGGDFRPDFWDVLWRQQLSPIFTVLRSRPEMSNVLNHEELSVWLSTTMIQALRNMITLFTHYFDALAYMLDRFLNLLSLCILQENDTIARIGSNCLQQLILQNVAKFTPAHWHQIVDAFCHLFEKTTAHQLFGAVVATTPMSPTPEALDFGGLMTPSRPVDGPPKTNGTESNGHLPQPDKAQDPARTPTGPTPVSAEEPPAQLEDYRPPSTLQQQPVIVTTQRRREFNRIISLCVLQLLMIETVQELFSNDAVYNQIPSQELLRLMDLLGTSFVNAQRFNSDKELRMRLWREGFMKQPPNLLKQESGAASTYIAILFKMFADQSAERMASKADVENKLVPLCKDVIGAYLALEEESQARNIVAWRPVVVDVLEGYASFPESAFSKHIKAFYQLVVELLSKDLTSELRKALLSVLRRVGEVSIGIDGMVASAQREEQRRDSTLSTTSTEGGATVEVEGGDASTRFMGRRMHSPPAV